MAKKLNPLAKGKGIKNRNLRHKKIKTILYSLTGIFILIIIYFAVPFEHLIKQNIFPIVAILGLLFLLLGIALIILSRKEKGKLKLFLRLTGISAISPLVFSILHNLFYALAIAFENFSFLFEPLHVVSFIISLLVAPILFLVGLIGCFILLKGN